MRMMIIGAVALLAGCAGGGLTTEQSAALRASAFAQLEAWRAVYPDAGRINDPVLRLSIGSACALGGTIVTVWNPSVEGMPERLASWCAELLRATAPVPAEE